MATQKQVLQATQEQAWRQGCTVTVRKNSHGEYETRVRKDGKYVGGTYYADSFLDGIGTAGLILANLKTEETRRERLADAQYKRDLLQAVWTLGSLLRTVGCTVTLRESGHVTFSSPKTGEHSLFMKRGVRPVSDLYAHGCGFAEQQTHP